MGNDCNYSCTEKANHSCANVCNDSYMANLLSDRIRHIRESAGDTPQKAADKVGVSRQAFMKWENGATANIKLGNLLTFCDRYRVAVESLLRDDIVSATLNVPNYSPPPPTLLVLNEPPPEERELIVGYRDASNDVKEIMLNAARNATLKKHFSTRSESQ